MSTCCRSRPLTVALREETDVDGGGWNWSISRMSFMNLEGLGTRGACLFGALFEWSSRRAPCLECRKDNSVDGSRFVVLGSVGDSTRCRVTLRPCCIHKRAGAVPRMYRNSSLGAAWCCQHPAVYDGDKYRNEVLVLTSVCHTSVYPRLSSSSVSSSPAGPIWVKTTCRAAFSDVSSTSTTFSNGEIRLLGYISPV